MDNTEQIKDNQSSEQNNELSWQIEEYAFYERSRNWYIMATAIAFLMLIFSFFNANFLFSVVVIMVSLIVILHDGRKPDLVSVLINDEGIQVGRRVYDYEEIDNFSIVYKPKNDIKNLYFEFKNPVRQRLSIPLKNADPLPIRKYLLKYLAEDLERTNIPLSETLAKILKL